MSNKFSNDKLNEKTAKVNSSFNQLATSEEFLSLMKHAASLRLNKDMLMEQADRMIRAGRDVDTVVGWLQKIVYMAQEQQQSAARIEANNMNKGLSNEQALGEEPRYSDSHMPSGTYFALKPVVHIAQLNMMNMTILMELYKKCTHDPEGRNPYYFHGTPLNKFLDESSFMMCFGQQQDDRIESDETEEIESKDEKTGKMSKRKIPIMVDNPLLPLYKIFGEKFSALTDEQKREIPDGFFDFLNNKKEMEEKGITKEAHSLFKKMWELQRKDLQNALRQLQTYQYVNVNIPSFFHHPDDITIEKVTSYLIGIGQTKDAQVLEEMKDGPDKDKLVREWGMNLYKRNEVIITKKGSTFMQMYFYVYDQANQRDVFANFCMMGLNKDLTW